MNMAQLNGKPSPLVSAESAPPDDDEIDEIADHIEEGMDMVKDIKGGYIYLPDFVRWAEVSMSLIMSIYGGEVEDAPK